MKLNSVRFQYAAASAFIFFGAFAAASIVSISVVRDQNQANLEIAVTDAGNKGVSALASINKRMAVYADIISHNPIVADALIKNDTILLEKLAVDQLNYLKKDDSTVSTFEMTNAAGIVVMRGHNPKQKGDDKSKLQDIKDALNGKKSAAMAVSPTTGRAALDALAPIMLEGKVIGTLKIGAYATQDMVQEIKAETRANIVTLFKGKVTASTLPKDVEVAFDTTILSKSVQNIPQVLQASFGNVQYRAYLKHLPSLAGEGLVIATLVDEAPYIAKIQQFITSILTYGGLSLLVALAIGLGIGTIFSRPLIRTANGLTSLAKGENASLEAYTHKHDEIGDMARAFSTLKGEVFNAFRFRQTIAGMPMGVMTLDRGKDWEIDYLNPALLAHFETEKTYLPCDGHQVSGQKASFFFQRLGLSAQSLNTMPEEGLRLPVTLGSTTFVLLVAHILSPAGDKIGAMIAWEDISQRARLAKQFESAVKRVADHVETASLALRERAERVRHSAGNAQIQAEAVARASEEASVSVTTVASAAEELLASIDEIRHQVENSTIIGVEAASESGKMVCVVQDLQAAASKIGAVVQLIRARRQLSHMTAAMRCIAPRNVLAHLS